MKTTLRITKGFVKREEDDDDTERLFSYLWLATNTILLAHPNGVLFGFSSPGCLGYVSRSGLLAIFHRANANSCSSLLWLDGRVLIVTKAGADRARPTPAQVAGTNSSTNTNIGRRCTLIRLLLLIITTTTIATSAGV